MLDQAISIGIVFVYDVVVTLIILKIVNLVIGLRVSEDVEREVSISRCTGDRAVTMQTAVGGHPAPPRRRRSWTKPGPPFLRLPFVYPFPLPAGGGKRHRGG